MTVLHRGEGGGVKGRAERAGGEGVSGRGTGGGGRANQFT